MVKATKTTHIGNETQVLRKHPLPNQYENTGRFRRTSVNQKLCATSLSWQHQLVPELSLAREKPFFS